MIEDKRIEAFRTCRSLIQYSWKPISYGRQSFPVFFLQLIHLFFQRHFPNN